MARKTSSSKANGKGKPASRPSGGELERLFQHTFAVAKQVRTETGIGKNPVSVAYAAVSMASRIFDDFSRARALLIGAGETIELVARHLHEAGVRQLQREVTKLCRAVALDVARGHHDGPEDARAAARVIDEADLGRYLVPGRNRVVITHIDDCCSARSLTGVRVVLNGASLTTCP